MRSIIITLLEAVIAAAVPIVAAFLVRYLKKKSEQLSIKTGNELAEHYITEVTEAVTTAVIATSQTYVDALKNKNVFTKAAQSEALKRAKNTALSIISPAAVDFVEEVYGDFESYLTAKIEEAVKVQKKKISIINNEVENGNI